MRGLAHLYGISIFSNYRKLLSSIETGGYGAKPPGRPPARPPGRPPGRPPDDPPVTTNYRTIINR